MSRREDSEVQSTAQNRRDGIKSIVNLSLSHDSIDRREFFAKIHVGEWEKVLQRSTHCVILIEVV